MRCPIGLSDVNNPLADPEDLSDIEFLLKHEPVTDAELRAAFDRVRMPNIPELLDAFRAAQPRVLALVKP